MKWRAAVTLLLCAAATGTQAKPALSRVDVRAPRGALAVAVMLGANGQLQYSATLDGREVILASPLGIRVDGVDLGKGSSIVRLDRYSLDERFPWRGVHSEARGRCSAVRVSLGHATSGTRWIVELRVFDDAAAFRFGVPGTGKRVPDAASGFRLPAGSTVWYHGLRDHYEGLHTKRELSAVPGGDWAAPPLTVRLPGGVGYAAITEAALSGYAGMVLQADGEGGFAERLGHAAPASYPYTLRYGEENARRLAVAAAVEGTITTPWRVVLAGRDLDTLVNSDAIASLNPPPDPKLFPRGLATSWLRTGRAVWRYLDGPSLAPIEGESPVARAQRVLGVLEEFSAQAGVLGFEHQIVEGQWRELSDDQLRGLVSHARERGVSIWVWLHSRDQMDAAIRRRLFARLHDLGIAGVKVDFLDHEAREVIDLYQAILRDAAEQQLLVNFHGANKPTGESRTWPNEMTREAIRGLEYRRTPAWAEHNTTVPFTRLLAGHADYTPLLFGERRKETSVVHQIATLVVFTSPVMVYGANPRSVIDSPARDLIRGIPSVWDETRVLAPSAPGEIAVFARRSGRSWYLGVLNGPAPRTVDLPLAFLGKGRYQATLARDAGENAEGISLEGGEANRTQTLRLTLRPGGGFVARLSR